MVLQPEDLGDLHLNRHLSPDIAQDWVTGCIYSLRLVGGAMIQPKNHIAVSVEC